MSVARWLDYQPDEMLAHFDRAPFVVRHKLMNHPLLQLPRIIELSRFLQPRQLEFNSGEIEVNQDYLNTPKTGLTAEETLQQIESANSWMVLKNVERDPEYHILLKECLDQVGQQSELIASGMCSAEAFIFVSSPNAVTPFHIDPEHNFLLQIHGDKTVFVFDKSDRELVSDIQLEQFYSGAHRNLPFAEKFSSRGRPFQLTPGNGIHIPVQSPHWVKNGSAASVSLSITFRTRASARRADIYRLNASLRLHGLRPRPPGSSAIVDVLKVGAAKVALKYYWQDQAD